MENVGVRGAALVNRRSPSFPARAGSSSNTCAEILKLFVAVASQVAQERPFDPRSEPRTLMLNNKMKLPLIGAHVTDGETATCA